MKCPKCGCALMIVAEGSPSGRSASSAPQADASEVGDLLDRIDDGALTESMEIDFVSQTRERYEKYGDRIRMSPKQLNWLTKLANR